MAGNFHRVRAVHLSDAESQSRSFYPLCSLGVRGNFLYLDLGFHRDLAADESYRVGNFLVRNTLSFNSVDGVLVSVDRDLVKRFRAAANGISREGISGDLWEFVRDRCTKLSRTNGRWGVENNRGICCTFSSMCNC